MVMVSSGDISSKRDDLSCMLYYSVFKLKPTMHCCTKETGYCIAGFISVYKLSLIKTLWIFILAF